MDVPEANSSTGPELTRPLRLIVTKEDVQTHFKEAPGTIAEVKLMNGFGFIEYEDALDARDVVPSKSLRSSTPSTIPDFNTHNSLPYVFSLSVCWYPLAEEIGRRI